MPLSLALALGLALALLTSVPVSLCAVTTVGELTVLEGGSITVPCHYDPRYAGYVKYWCSGRLREVCSSLARSDAPASGPTGAEAVSIFDDVVQLVFTVTMRGLKEQDSGWYWCGVEVGGIWSADVAASVHISVIHGMSVVNSRMSGEEGSSVSVECLYSERYRESEKKWCRSGDWGSCVAAGPRGTHEDTALLLADDGAGTFSVTLRRLQMRDAGWYWCSAGQQQMAVHLAVTPRPSTTAVSIITSPASQHHTSSPSLYVPAHKSMDRSLDYHSHVLASPLLACAAIVLLVALVILTLKMWNHYKKTHRRRQTDHLKARLSSLQHQEHVGDGDWQSASVVFLNPAS